MKVLGLTKIPHPTHEYLGRDGYIAIVSHDELERALEKGYSNKLEPLKVGAELDLGSIPDQRARVVAATEAMTKAYEQFVKAAPVMADVARVIGAAGNGIDA